MQEDSDEVDQKSYGKDIIERFKRIKNQYLRIHSLIWDKANSYVQVY